MNDLLDLVRDIARQLPTGLTDPRALTKLRDEQAELAEKLATGDQIGALTELADVVYYAVKAHVNDLLRVDDAQAIIETACADCGVDPAHVIAFITAKYATRMRGVKDDEAERAAVAAAWRGLAHQEAR